MNMTDDRLKEEAKKVFELYWFSAKIAFGEKMDDGLKGFAQVIFVAGYVEGRRSKEDENK